MCKSSLWDFLRCWATQHSTLNDRAAPGLDVVHTNASTVPSSWLLSRLQRKRLSGLPAQVHRDSDDGAGSARVDEVRKQRLGYRSGARQKASKPSRESAPERVPLLTRAENPTAREKTPRTWERLRGREACEKRVGTTRMRSSASLPT